MYRAHPWLMGSLHVKFHDDRCKGKAVMRRKPKCGRTDGRTDRRTDGQTDGRTDGHGDSSIPPPNFVVGGIMMQKGGIPPIGGGFSSLQNVNGVLLYCYHLQDFYTHVKLNTCRLKEKIKTANIFRNIFLTWMMDMPSKQLMAILARGGSGALRHIHQNPAIAKTVLSAWSSR